MGCVVITEYALEQLRALPAHSVELALVVFTPRDEDEFADYAAACARVLRPGRGHEVITSQDSLADAFLNV